MPEFSHFFWIRICYRFGDATTRDDGVLSFNPANNPCAGIVRYFQYCLPLRTVYGDRPGVTLENLRATLEIFSGFTLENLEVSFQT